MAAVTRQRFSRLLATYPFCWKAYTTALFKSDFLVHLSRFSVWFVSCFCHAKIGFFFLKKSTIFPWMQMLFPGAFNLNFRELFAIFSISLDWLLIGWWMWTCLHSCPEDWDFFQSVTYREWGFT